MDKANQLRIALIDLDITLGGSGWNDIVCERAWRELYDFYCVMTDADRGRVWNIAKLLATYPQAPEVQQAANQAFERVLAWCMSGLTEPKGAVAVIEGREQ